MMSNYKCAICGYVFQSGEAILSLDPIHLNSPYYCTTCEPKAKKHQEQWMKDLTEEVWRDICD